MKGDSFSEIDLDQLKRINSAAVEFEESLAVGKPISIEQQLSSFPDALKRPLLRELLHSEFEWRRRAGQAPEPTEYHERFPDAADLVEAVFAESSLADPAEQPTAELRALSESTPFTPADSATNNQGFPFQIDGYEVVGVLGRGGMGVVYRAHDPQLNRTVALKALLPELSVEPTARARFLREARASAAIRHPAVVAIYAVDDQHDPPYLVLEYVDGQSLADLLQDGQSLNLQDTLSIARDIAAGLSAAHRQGIIHRDIKPANILIEALDGRARLADFGLASALSDRGSVTMTGEVLGTPRYMSPEQIDGRELDERSDLFSVGVVLYLLVTGQLPFVGESPTAIIRHICDHDPTPVGNLKPNTPFWLQSLIGRLLQKEPAQRVQSADKLLQYLETESDSLRTETRHWKVTGACLAFVAVLAFSIWASVSRTDSSDSAIPTTATGGSRTLLKPSSTIHQDNLQKASETLNAGSGQPSPASRKSDKENVVSEKDSPGPNAADWLVDSGRRYGNANASDVVSADMNNDGYLDIVVANGTFQSPQPNQLWLNDGVGSFRLSEQQIGNRVSAAVCVGDVDGDLTNDVFFANWSEDRDEVAKNSLWYNDGNGLLRESSQQFDTGSARDAAFGDLNGDGSLDLWVANYNEEDTVWLNDGDGNFTQITQELPGRGTATVTLIDMNRNMSLDAVVTGQGRHSIGIWQNNGDGKFSEVYWIENGKTQVEDFGVAGDLNTDGLPDVVISSRTSLEIYLNAGANSLCERSPLWKERPARKVYLVDLNGDDVLDIVYGTKKLDGVYVGINDGQGNFTHRSHRLEIKGLTSLATGDFDKDGDLDIYFATGHKNFSECEDQLWINTIR